MADLWIDIGVPKKTGQEKKGRERTRDKIIGFFAGAKGNQEKDVKDCRAHIQVYIGVYRTAAPTFSCTQSFACSRFRRRLQTPI